jgi:predicted cation transporter
MGLLLLLPFFSKRAEEELETFLLLMGILAVTFSGGWSRGLLFDSLREPLPISLGMLAAGFFFYAIQDRVQDWTGSAVRKFRVRPLLFMLVTGLGLGTALLNCLITPLLLSEILMVLHLPRAIKAKIAVLACMAIGLGSILSPLGGPLAAITFAKLNAGPFFALRLLGWWLIPMIVGLGWGAALYPVPEGTVETRPERYRPETPGSVVARALKVYFFMVGLLLLAAGFTPMVQKAVNDLPPQALYWINTVSAVLDNASLAAVEVNPLMPMKTLQYLLLGLLLSGVMLIPGNLPNLIVAQKLGIKSREWAQLGVPLGLAFMTVYFFALFFLAG